MNDSQGDPDGSSVEEREQAVARREARLDAQESRHAERKEEVMDVLSKADKRDDAADARDWASSKRDMAANMRAWMSDEPNYAEAEAREEALGDRVRASEDRDSSSTDRAVLAVGEDLDEE